MKKKKKIIIAAAIVLILILAMGCGGNNDAAPVEDGSEAAETTEVENEDTEQAEASDAEETSDEDSDDGGLLSPEFKKTMDDYEAWFDHYCEVMKKYQDNPTDLELMSEVTDLLTEETKMLEQMEAMDESEMNDAELAYYIEVTARIEKKLLEVANY